MRMIRTTDIGGILFLLPVIVMMALIGWGPFAATKQVGGASTGIAV